MAKNNKDQETLMENAPSLSENGSQSEESKASQSGKVTDIAESKGDLPKHHDATILPNQNPKFRDLLQEHTDPKKLVGKNESQIDKALSQYYKEGDVKALQGFLKIYMYFPRPMVRKAEKYLDTLLDKNLAGSGKTEGELKKMNTNQLAKIGSGLGVYFDAGRSKESMIKSILDMQKLQTRRQKA